jgi:adenine-specific DNA-methyltransferase
MSDRSLVPEKLLEFARNLRRGQSEAEGILWAFLRDRRLLGLKFRRQHPIGPYIADFFCSELNWVIELDGGQHNTDEARSYDTRRTEFLQSRGVEVTRFWNNQVACEAEAVVERLLDLAESMTARMREGTLTPALSQREREKESRALSQREREKESRALSHTPIKQDKE